MALSKALLDCKNDSLPINILRVSSRGKVLSLPFVTVAWRPSTRFGREQRESRLFYVSQFLSRIEVIGVVVEEERGREEGRIVQIAGVHVEAHWLLLFFGNSETVTRWARWGSPCRHCCCCLRRWGCARPRRRWATCGTCRTTTSAAPSTWWTTPPSS